MPEESIKECVIDASFMLSHLLPDENSDSVKALFKLYKENKIKFISSPIFPLEVLNGIRYSFIRKRIDQETAKSFVNNFLELRVEVQNVNTKEVFSLSLKENLSVYDASYIWLAKNNNTSLLTLDKNLINIIAK